MRKHKYAYWGLGHMSHPEDPVGCCSEPASAPVHLCMDGYRNPDGGVVYCQKPYGHKGVCYP